MISEASSSRPKVWSQGSAAIVRAASRVHLIARCSRAPCWPSTPRGLAGKPLAGFCTTPSRRITVVYGVISYAIRFKTPSLHR